jgi:hypothetical protein
MAARGTGSIELIAPLFRVGLIAAAILGVWMYVQQRGERRALDDRKAVLMAGSIAPGSALSCLDELAGEAVESACEKTVFASPEAVASAVKYVAAQIELLNDGPDGSIGPGSAIRLREHLGANPRYEVNVITEIERLDEQGFVHNPIFHGISGLARMEYQFTEVPTGTLYENCLIVGAARGAKRLLSPLITRRVFGRARGLAWIRHNIEEVGMLENILPPLYEQAKS